MTGKDLSPDVSTVPAITKLKNIFDSGELVSWAVVSVLETTAADGKASRPELTDSAKCKRGRKL
jgi:hypothetical protein